MQTTLRAIKLLMLVIWLGGLIFFGAVLAPVAFTRLPSTHMAGMVEIGRASCRERVYGRV